jgi:uncharacterized protein (TIGR03083 family)
MSKTLDQSPTRVARTVDLDRTIAMRLAATEYERVVAMLEALTPEQWQAPTECTGWDVRAMAGHILGMTQMAATVRETLRQSLVSGRRAKRSGCLPIDALTAVQVEKNEALTREELLRALRRTGPKAAAARRRTPAVVRNRTLPEVQVVGGAQEWWTIGYLLDVILTRDPFMHRIDIARATGAPMQSSADHEGVIVDDVVREWAGRHGQAYALVLTGPAGGRWGSGQAEPITMDAFDFCRALSGRAAAPGLLSEQVPF